MKCKALQFVLILAITTSCATIFNNDRQLVYIKGGPENGITTLSTPDGTYNVENGQGAFMMSRQRADIPVRVTCPDGTKKSLIVATSYDWGTGWLNIFNYGVGFFEAIMYDRAYDIDNITLYDACHQTNTAAIFK